MKRLLSVLLALTLILGLTVPALAAGDGYTLSLQVNSASAASVKVGDTITVELLLAKDGAERFELYSFQDYVRFDPSCLSYIEGSAKVYSVKSGEQTKNVLRASALEFDGEQVDRVFVNRADSSAESVSSGTVLLSFKLKATKAGTAAITHDTVELFQTVGELYTVSEKSATVTISNSGSGGGTGGGTGGGGGATAVPSESSDVFIVGEKGKISNIKAEVSIENEKATVEIAATDVERVLEDGKVLMVDLSEKPVTSISISANAIQAVSVAGASLNVKLTGGELELDAAALKAVISAGTGETVTLSLKDVTSTSALFQTNSNVEAVFELGAARGSTAVSSFNGGTAKVCIPFTPATGRSPSGYYIALISGSTQTPVAGSSYNAAIKCMEMTRSSFSTYAVVWKALPFTDTRGHWAEDAIAWTYRLDLMKGTSDTTFSPGGTMTREMLATVLYRMEGQPAADQTRLSAYPDAAVINGYAKDAMAWAVEKGILQGGDSGLMPGGSITREQLAAMLYRYAGLPEVSGASLSSYADNAAVSAYAVNALKWATSNGIITGTTTGTLNPQGSATRAHIAVMLQRFKGLTEKA